MSHFTLLTLGSRGDVVPYLALGRRLRAAGHGVRVATYQNFGSAVADYGLDFHPTHVDVEAVITGREGKALLASGQNVLRQALAIGRTFGRVADATAQDLLHPALRDTDAVLCQTPGARYGADLAEAAGVPLIQLAVMLLARTHQRPHLGFPAGLGRLPGFTRLSYPLAEQLVWQMFRPPDWPAHVHQTSYWFPHDQSWQPPADLLRFLEAGPPPVFVGFGSMPLRHPAATTATLLEALRLSGQRGLLHAGWGGLAAQNLPPTVFSLQYSAFEWLFPRMAAVVHHGGAGTTGMGLRSGVPSVLVPFAFDQFLWAARVVTLGVGPRPMALAALTPQRLAEAITTAVNDPAMRQRAQALGEALAAEDGLGQAVGLVERYSVRAAP